VEAPATSRPADGRHPPLNWSLLCWVLESRDSPGNLANLIAPQRNTEADPARIELATLCLGSSRTSVVLRADQRRGCVRDSFFPAPVASKPQPGSNRRAPLCRRTPSHSGMRPCLYVSYRYERSQQDSNLRYRLRGPASYPLDHGSLVRRDGFEPPMSVDGGFTVRCIPALPPTHGVSSQVRTDDLRAHNAALRLLSYTHHGRSGRDRTCGLRYVGPALWPSELLIVWHPRRDSNSDCQVRSLVVCPLAYEGLVPAP
jgi:hypothetical protein